MRQQQIQLINKAKAQGLCQSQLDVLSREDVTVKALRIIYEYFFAQNQFVKWSGLKHDEIAAEANRCVDLVEKFKYSFLNTITYHRCLSAMLGRSDIDRLHGTYGKRRICWAYAFASYITKKNYNGAKHLPGTCSSPLNAYVSLLYNGLDSHFAVSIIRHSLEQRSDCWGVGSLLQKYPVLIDDAKYNKEKSLISYLIRNDIVRLFKPTQTALNSMYDKENHCFNFPLNNLEFNQRFVREGSAWGYYVENKKWIAEKEIDNHPMTTLLHKFCKKNKMRVDKYTTHSGVFGKWHKWELADESLVAKFKECSAILPMSFSVKTMAWSLSIQTEYSFFSKIIYSEYGEVTADGRSGPDGWTAYKPTYIVDLTVFPDGNIYRSGKDGNRPLSVRELFSFKMKTNIFGRLMDELIDYYQKKNPFVKDVLSDCFPNCFPTMIVSDINTYHNKSDFIKNKYKTSSKIKVNWNKRNLNVAYFIIKAYPKVADGISKNILAQQTKVDLLPEDYSGALDEKITRFLANVIVEKVVEHQKAANQSAKSKGERYRQELFDEIGPNFLEDEVESYVTERLMDSRYMYELRRMAYDYVNMCITSKQKVRLDVSSFQQAVNLHNEINSADNYYRLRTGSVKVPKNSKFNALRKILPDDFEWIKSRRRLIVETELQHHCVWSYANKITSDNCAIYSYVDKKAQHTKDGKPKRYTIEFMIDDDDKYYIEQVQGKYDRVNTSVMTNFIQKILDEKQKKEK